MPCRRQKWHPFADCEDSDVVEARQFRKLTSDLFHPRGSVPATQNEIMTRNNSVSPLLRLPPEIRLRIYGFVLGGQKLWIDYSRSRISYIPPGDYRRKEIIDKTNGRFHIQASEILARDATHCAGQFYHFNIDSSGKREGFDLRLLRVCRQVFTETALLPYALNKFVFARDEVRAMFESSVRPGKKLVQKKAVGRYEIMNLSQFEWLAVDDSIPGWYAKMADAMGIAILD